MVRGPVPVAVVPPSRYTTRNHNNTGSNSSNVENSSPPSTIRNNTTTNKATISKQNTTTKTSTTTAPSFRVLSPESLTMTGARTGRLCTSEPLHDSSFSATAGAVATTTITTSSGAAVRQTIDGNKNNNLTNTSSSSTHSATGNSHLMLQQQQQPVYATTKAAVSSGNNTKLLPLSSLSTTVATPTSGGAVTSASSAMLLEKGHASSNAAANITHAAKDVISSTAASPSSVTGGSLGGVAVTNSLPTRSTSVVSVQSNQYPPTPHQPLRERRDSHSVVSQTSGPDAGWQWQENNNPDDQEQALFEQRLCEDIYGVAVRKINQNGKSSLRYVKCCTIDANDLEHFHTSSNHASSSSSLNYHHNSSSRSLSSRSWSSRNGFSRFLVGGGGGTNSANNSQADPKDYNDAHRTLIPGKKIQVLTWGKKKDVKVPIDRFVAVRKGKTTDRAKRNPCPASRILSLITSSDDETSYNHHAASLDIEAPTRLDRDKFARAFSRFLNIPLLDGDQQILPSTTTTQLMTTTTATTTINDMRSVRSDMTPQSFQKDQRFPSKPHPVSTHGYMQDSVGNSSVPDIAMTNSFTTNGSSRPLPVVTTSFGVANGGTSGLTNSKPPSKPTSRIFNRTRKNVNSNHDSASSGNNNSSNDNNNRNLFSSSNNRNSFDISDPPIASLQSSSRHGAAANGSGDGSSFNNTNSVTASFGGAGGFHLHQHHETPTKEATLEIPVTPQQASSTPAASSHPHVGGGDDAGSIVSSITGAGFDQDLVEELHLALEKMKGELEESRAEAARAVKVAEQAIQSAENSNSKDWNSTVTHKAAEAAAAAQKRSAEAMAKLRLAEERLEAEKKNSSMWKKQVESAEEKAGHWQTRAAAAEVQRFAVADALESEKKKNEILLKAVDGSPNGISNATSSNDAFDPFENSFRELPSSEVAEEVDRLRSKLGMESARRRKLLDELQDLRGAVRVYCRPYSASNVSVSSSSSTIALASHEVLMLNRETKTRELAAKSPSLSPLSFEFDGILPSDMDQHDVYAEFEAICSSVVEGYKICMMTYGQSNAGKTYTMLGEIRENDDLSITISDDGIHFRAMKQVFSVLEHRQDSYHDAVTMTLVEVHDERLIDLLAGTDYGEAVGKIEGLRRSSSRKNDLRSDDGTGSCQANSISSSKPKLEIKTNRDGETVVQGVLSVEVNSFDDVYRIWTESLSARTKRLAEQNIDSRAYEMGSHVIATLKIVSKNLSTGTVTSGKMQFVDFASSDIVTKRTLGSSPKNKSDDWKFVNKSLNTLSEVVRGRSQYQRSIPYRNSTITHLLSDSLEADTKVVMIACVSPDEKDLQNTTCTLRFAQEIRKVVVGKATRHTTTTASSAAHH